MTVSNIKDVKITSFEKGSSANPSSPRRVCAVGFGENLDGYKIKGLFKDQDAVDVYTYMSSRWEFKDQVIGESADFSGSIREIRTKTKEIIIDNITELRFKISLEIKVK